MTASIRFDSVWAWVDVAGEIQVILDRALSYEVRGAEFSLVHEAGLWDGRKHLLRRKDGRFPAGLLDRAVAALRAAGIECSLRDLRGPPPADLADVPEFFVRPPGGAEWRPYQRRAIEAALAAGRGVIAAPPRSGKTLIGAAVVGTIGRKTLWIAPTNAIVGQTTRVLREQFGDDFVGVVGDGERDLGRRFTVSTAAGAAALPAEWLADVRVLMIDEFHHASAPSYLKISRACPGAWFRYGMSGTFFRVDGTDMEMHGILSNELIRIGVSDLVCDGYLVPALVLFQPVSQRIRANHHTARRIGVAEHAERNAHVIEWARRLVGIGRSVVVLVEQIEHGKALSREMPAGTEFAQGGRAAWTTEQIAAFNAGRVPVLIGTSILGEGVDLPRADALIFARSGKAATTVWQSVFRVLTAYPGKQSAVIVDFADRHNRHLLQWSLERLRLYAAEPSFTVRVLPTEAPSAHPSLPLP